MVTDAKCTEKMQFIFIGCSSSDESRLNGDEGLRGASEVYSHLMQIYFKTPQALFHITTLLHFTVS